MPTPPAGLVQPAPTASRGLRSWTLCWAGARVDVDIEAADDARLADLLPGLRSAVDPPAAPGTGVWDGSRELPADTPLSSPALGHGAVLGLGRPGPRGAGGSVSALELHVTGGPDAGRTVPLSRGQLVLGRGRSCGLALADPDVSRRHAVLDVGDGAITLADLGSSNGTWLGALPLAGEPRPWTTGEPVRIGASTLQLAGPTDVPAPTTPGGAGRLHLRPHRRISTPRPATEVVVPAAPSAPPRRRLGWVAMALPAVGGGLMAWLLSTPQFLFFALLSPLVALGTWVSDRWSGRRQGRREGIAHRVALAAAEQELADAVTADVADAQLRAPDAATLSSATRRRTWPLWQRGRSDPDAVVLRIGDGPGPTRVTRRDGDGSATVVPAGRLPVTVDLRATGGLGVVGPPGPVRQAAAAILLQLTALHPPGELQLLLVTADVARWAWARWLPHLAGNAVLCPPVGPAGDESLHRALLQRVATQRARGVAGAGWSVLLIDRSLPAATSQALQDAAGDGMLTVSLAALATELSVPTGALLTIGGETGHSARLTTRTAPPREVASVDLVGTSTAADHARALAPLSAPNADDELPVALRLAALLPRTPGTAPGWSRSRTRLVATLGRSVSGPHEIDLCAQGPHALVAGTTGSGKSELLQTLVASLALTHPPDRCSFLLVDYKGGAAFAETAALPHTVGMVTDLDPQSTARALRSLTAELARREHLLAEHDVRDLAELPAAVPLARLVIVVDEFASLAEDLPGFVSGLVGIAQRGRSLGVHLVLATQRPAGVVSPEIRANCSLRICLRTADEVDSRDVLGTVAAAHLPADRPGRAWIRHGQSDPTLVQIARVSTVHGGPVAGPVVRRRRWPDVAPTAGATPAGPGTGPTDLAELVADLRAAAQRSGTCTAHRPWQPPLPDVLTVDELSGLWAELPDGGTRLPLGLIDRPDTQRRELLALDLDEAGGWLAVGGPRSGRTGLLRSVLGGAVAALPPSRLQVLVLDHGGGALSAEAATLPHAATTISGPDGLRTQVLLHALTAEIGRRRSTARTGADPHLLLLVDGIESVGALLDEVDPAVGSTGLLRLVRDGSAVGLTCVLSGDRAVPGGRTAAVAQHRLVLPLADRADYAVAGVPPRAVPAHRPPGRALIGEEAWECQLARPPDQLAPRLDPDGAEPPTGLRVPELEPDPVLYLEQPRETHPGRHPGTARLWLPVGPGGDDGSPVGVDLLRSGGLLVVGPGGSGRTSALDAFTAHWRAGGTPVLRVRREATNGPAAAGVLELAEPSLAQLRAWVDQLSGCPAVVVVDELATLADDVADTLVSVCRASRGVVLVAAGSPADLGAAFRGPAVALRRSRSGLLLRPAPGDADVLGVRLPRARVADRPGSGWLVTDGVPRRVQVARHRLPAGRHRAPASAPGDPR